MVATVCTTLQAVRTLNVKEELKGSEIEIERS